MVKFRQILTPRQEHTFGDGNTEDNSLGTRLLETALEVTRHPLPPIEGVPKDQKLLEELEFDILKDGSGQARPFQFSKGYPFGMSFGQKLYQTTDPYIKDAPLRNAVSEELGKCIWKERGGVAHLGGQLFAFLTLGKFPTGSVGPSIGIYADAFLRYRTLYPYTGQKYEDLTAPLTAKMAADMPAGSEFEFITHIAGGGSVGGSVVEGAGVGPAMGGLALYMTSTIGASRQLGICVTALNKKGQVRVTVRRLNQVNSSFTTGFMAGLMFIANTWTTKLNPNASMIPTSKTTSNYLGSFTGISTANASASAGETDNFINIFSVDLDTTDPEAQDIYQQILMLRFTHALDKATTCSAATNIALANEKSTSLMRDASITVMTETLIQDTQTHEHTSGNINLPTGYVSYTDSTVGDKQTAYGFGSREVRWQEVNAEDELCQDKKPYFQFRYADTDLHFSKKRLLNFIRFAKMFGIEEEELIKGGALKLAALKERLGKAAKVETTSEIYFTTKGIENILSSSPDQIKKAYLEASRLAKSDYEDSPVVKDDDQSKEARELLALFAERSKKHRFDIFGITKEMNDCYLRYEKLTGRSLSMDYGLLDQADNFAKLLTRAERKDCLSEGAETLFAELGKRKMFDFKQSIGALLLLASREEVRVKELSLKSGTIKLEVTPENAISHPHNALAKHLVGLSTTA